MMTTISYASLLDRAVAEAKRAGHSAATPLHLVRVLALQDPARFTSAFDQAKRDRLQRLFEALPRTFGTVEASKELGDMLREDDGPAVGLEALWERLKSALATPTPPTPEQPTPTAGESGTGESAAEPPLASSGPAYRPALQSLVALLHDRALDEAATDRLLRHVLDGSPRTEWLSRFARFVFTANPVIVIESDFPFAEEVVYEVLLGMVEPAQRRRAVPPQIAGEELVVQVPTVGSAVMLLPQYAGERINQLARVCRELSTRDVSVLIGCEKFAFLPEPLRRITDQRIRLRAIDTALFPQLFTAAIGIAPPTNWDRDAAQWLRHVQHTDFEQPQRLGLDADRALGFIRESVAERVRTVDSTQGKGLDALHGLGDAARFAHDLIREIAEAVAGRLSWNDVDRGVLLAGPPGTGKTTLARAIAKECGVKFVSASVAGWQSVGHLGDHIVAIRGTFAEARRYAPAILFLDKKGTC